LYVMNYVDHDPGAGVLDFQCGQRTYNTHGGLDLALTSFHAMDQGTPVYAAEGGTVLLADDHHFDRNMSTPYVGTLKDVNMVHIRHADGTTLWYAHLRRNSVSVAVGETVARGQVLGMIGSSGWSPMPHLHFEMRAGASLQSAVIDPYGTPCGGGQNRWSTPEPYSGKDAINLYDADVTLELGLLGSFGNLNGLELLKERLERPVVVAASEPRLGLWLFHQSPLGGPYEVRVIRPDGTVHTELHRIANGGRPFGWEVLAIPFAAAGVIPGTWLLEVQAGARVVTRQFEVGAATEFGPRFEPLRGRSVRLDRGGAEETLMLRRPVDAPQFRLEGAPPGVSLAGNRVAMSGAVLTARDHVFRVVVTDAKGRADTMHIHLVDRTRSPNPPFWRP